MNSETDTEGEHISPYLSGLVFDIATAVSWGDAVAVSMRFGIKCDWIPLRPSGLMLGQHPRELPFGVSRDRWDGILTKRYAQP